MDNLYNSLVLTLLDKGCTLKGLQESFISNAGERVELFGLQESVRFWVYTSNLYSDLPFLENAWVWIGENLPNVNEYDKAFIFSEHSNNIIGAMIRMFELDSCI